MVILRYQYKHSYHYWTHRFLDEDKIEAKKHFEAMKPFLCYAEINGRAFYWGEEE